MQEFRELAEGLVTIHGATAEVFIRWGSVPVVNRDSETDVAVAAARTIVGTDAVNTNGTQSTGGEDFAFMLEKRPGAMIGIGDGISPDGTWHALHMPKYNFNDDILPLGAP